jgi:hypothetical protein
MEAVIQAIFLAGNLSEFCGVLASTAVTATISTPRYAYVAIGKATLQSGKHLQGLRARIHNLQCSNSGIGCDTWVVLKTFTDDFSCRELASKYRP